MHTYTIICFEIKFFCRNQKFSTINVHCFVCVYVWQKCMVSKELKRITESLRTRRMRIGIFLFCFLARFWYVILEKINYYSPLTRIIILERISILDIVFLLKYRSKMIVIFFCFVLFCFISISQKKKEFRCHVQEFWLPVLLLFCVCVCGGIWMSVCVCVYARKQLLRC